MQGCGREEGRGTSERKRGNCWLEYRKSIHSKFTNKEVHKGIVCEGRRWDGWEEGVLQQEYQGHFAPTQTLGVG